MPLIYASMAPTSLGPSLALELGGLVVVSEFDNTDSSRTARATIPSLQVTNAAMSARFECTFYGDGATEDLAFVGLCKTEHPPSVQIGTNTSSVALDIGSGGIYLDSTLVEATPPIAKEDTVGVYLDRSVSPPVAYFFVNGSFLASAELSTGAWYPAVSLGNAKAFDLKAYLNFGQRAFEYALATDSGIEKPSLGWYRTTVQPAPAYVSSIEGGGYTTTFPDSPAGRTFNPHLLNSGGFTITRKCQVWTQGGSASNSTFAELEIDNRTGLYDRLLREDWRNQPVTVDVHEVGTAFNTRSRVATGIIDKIRAGGEDTIRIAMRDRMADLERPVQLRPFPPYVDDGAANRPRPIILGACRNVPPLLFDQENRIYSLSDQAVTNITAVRDKGALLDPHGLEPQYFPRNNLMDLELQTLPEGLLTADVSSEGDQVQIPGADDVLEGKGSFSDWSGVGAPDGWTFVLGGTGELLRVPYQSPQNWSLRMRTTHTYNPTLAGEVGSYIRYDDYDLIPGRTYRISFKVARVVGNPPELIGGITAGLHVRTDITGGELGSVTPWPWPVTGPTGATPAGAQAKTFVYTVPPGSPRKLYFIASSSQTAGGGGNGSALVQIHAISVELLGDVLQYLPLQGIGLTAYMRNIFQNHGGLTQADWDADDTDLIDAETGYAFGVNIRDPMTIKDAAAMPLDTYCATQFVDAAGAIRTRRWRDPALAKDSEVIATFDVSNIEYGVTSDIDLAPGLTTTIGARRNWQIFGDSDFVTDYVTVPAALRVQFKRLSQLQLPAAGSLPATYQFAEQAPPLDSLLDAPEQAQTEIDRVVRPYTAARTDSTARVTINTLPRFVTFTHQYDGPPPTYLFGDIIKVTYNRFGLDAGQQMMVWDTAMEPYNRRITISAWGSK